MKTLAWIALVFTFSLIGRESWAYSCQSSTDELGCVTRVCLNWSDSWTERTCPPIHPCQKESLASHKNHLAQQGYSPGKSSSSYQENLSTKSLRVFQVSTEKYSSHKGHLAKSLITLNAETCETVEIKDL